MPTARIAAVLAISGALGFAVGVLVQPTWQDVLEPAQVLAGLVAYPPDNPVYIYSTSTWTLLHQVPALLLRLGFSERLLALLVSGVRGAVCFQALGLVVLALSEDVALAILAPVFIYAARTTWGGISYPVSLVGLIYTSGAFGLAFVLLICGLAGVGAFPAAALLLGLSLAVHPTLGAAAVGIFGIAAFLSGAEIRQQLWNVRYWFLGGLAISGISAAIHAVWFAPHLSPLTSGDLAKYMGAIMRYWDEHRRPFMRFSVEAAPGLTCMAVSLFALWRLKHLLGAPARFLLAAFVAAGLMAAGLSAIVALQPTIFDYWLWRFMPSRLMNLPVLACVAVLMGVAGRFRRSLSEWVLAGMVGALMVNRVINRGGYDLALMSFYVMLVSGVALMTALLIDARAGRSGGRPTRSLLGFTVLAVPVMFLALMAWRLPATFAAGRDDLRDRTTDAFLAKVAERPGLLVTASDLHLVQLQTRRGVLLDGGAIDGLAYITAAAPATERILRRIYDIEFVAPPFDMARASGSLPHVTGRSSWQARTQEEWRVLSETFAFTDVLVFRDWELQLPEVARGDDLVLYSIPR